MPFALGQAHLGQQLLGFLHGLHFAGAPHLTRPKCHVLLRGELWKQVELLEHHARLTPDLAYRAFAAFDTEPVYQQVAAVNLLQRIDTTQQGRFARTRRPDQHHHLALVDLQIHPIEHHRLAKALAHFFEFNHAHRMRIRFSSWRRPKVSRPTMAR